MDIFSQIQKLSAISTEIGGGNRLRIAGTELLVMFAAIHNDPKDNNKVLMHLKLRLPDETDAHDTTACGCPICSMVNEINTAGSIAVFDLLTEGHHKKLVVDSSGACEGGFTVKLRNKATRRCDVSEGPSLKLATARALIKANNA